VSRLFDGTLKGEHVGVVGGTGQTETFWKRKSMTVGRNVLMGYQVTCGRHSVPSRRGI
jgi:hypothetical protein